jgi:hypothetical protein
MRPRGSVEGVVILACVAVTAFFGFACTLNDNGDSGSAPIGEVLLHPDRADARECATPPGLLAAVPGGLCLLI